MQSILSALTRLDQRLETPKKYLDPVVACLLATIPFLQHYIGIVDNAATTLMMILMPYLILRLLGTLPTFKLVNLRFAVVLMAFLVYRVINHGTRFMEIAQAGLMGFYLVCICQECIDTKALKKAAICIGMLVSVLLVAQHLCYNLFDGFHLQLVPTSALLSESEAWILCAQTGTYSITGRPNGFYRPSGFFLEPSHMFLYCFPLVFITLFDEENKKENKWIALLITLGIILSSSGMGILVVFGAWGLFFGFRGDGPDDYRFMNIFRKRNMIQTIIYVIAFVLAIVYIPFLEKSVLRIFFNDGGSTAIDGRTELALIALKDMTISQLLTGISDITGDFSFNMPGFMGTLYAQGILGILLSYEVYVKGMVMLKMPYLWFTAMILVVSFFSAHTHGTFFMLYFLMLLKEGYNTSMRDRKETIHQISRFGRFPRKAQ